MMVQDLVYRISATNAGLKTVVRDSQQSIRSLMDTADKSVRSLENMSKKMSRTGTILFTGISALTKKTIDSAASFEKSMRRVQAVSQATASEYQKLSTAALEMSTRTEHSAMAVAEGMNFMAMAGFKANEIMEAMPSVLQLASAGVMDLGTAADITTNILTGYGLELSELARANDILVSAMTGANVDLVGLGESFKYVGPLAKAAGIEFSETAAMIALMGNAGIQGSMAGTSLRQAITNLLNPTKQAREVMDRLGIKTRDANDNLLSMTEILRQLEDRGASASDMMILFGQRAGPAMSALLGQGVDELEKFQQRLEDAEGLATRIEAMMVDTAEGQKTIFKNTVNAIRIMFGQDMIPYYRTAVFFLQGIADRIKQMEPQQRMQIIRITAITGAVVGLVAVLGFLGMAVASIIKGFLSFGSAIMFLMSMKGLAIGAIILAVGLLKKAWDNDFGGIKTKTEEVWKVVGPVLESFWEILQRSWAWTVDIAEDIWDWIINTTWAEKWEDIKGWLDTTWNWAITIGTGIKEWIFDTTWAEKWEDIKNWLDTTWEWTVNLLGDAWEWLEKNAPWLTTTLETLWGYVEKAWEWAINTTGDAWAWFKDTTLGQWLDDLKAKITDSKAWKWTIDVALPAILEGGEFVLKAIIEASGRMYDSIKKGLDTGDWSDFWNVASEVWSTGVVVAITLSSVVNGIQAVLSAITSGLGLVAATGASLGLPGLIGALSVGIQLMEAQAEGSYENFAKNVIAAGLIAAFLYPVTGPGGALAGFNLVLNLKIGEDAYDGFVILFEWISYNLEKLFSGQWGQFMSLDDFIASRAKEKVTILFEGDYAENLQYAIAETKKHDPELWDEYAAMYARIWDVDEDEIRAALGLDLIGEAVAEARTLQDVLDAIYNAEGGATAKIPYGMTSFANKEVSYVRAKDNERFAELSAGTAYRSEEYWRAAAQTTVEMWWDHFTELFPSLAGQHFDDVSADVQQLFLVYLGKWFAPPEAHELNPNWIPNVAKMLGFDEMSETFRGDFWKTFQTLVDVIYEEADGDIAKATEYMAQTIADYLIGQSPPPKGPLSNIKLGMKNTMSAGIEGAEEGLLGGIGRLLSAAQKIGEAAQAWGRDVIHYFIEGVEEEATNQQARMEQIASRILMPITFDNPENDAWIFGSGVDLMQWFGKGIASAAQGVVEIVRMLIDKVFDAILKVIQERYPELLEFFNSLKEEVDEGIKAVEEFVLKLGGGDEGEKAIKQLDAVTTSWLQNLSNGLASAIVHGESLFDVFDNLLRMIAQQALSGFFMRGISSVLSKAGYSIPTMHFGGLVMHSGGMIEGLRPDEVPIIAQKGERILSRKQNDQFEQMLENFTGAGGQNINLNIYANDAKSFVDMVRRNPEAIVSVLVDDYQGNGIIRRLVRG